MSSNALHEPKRLLIVDDSKVSRMRIRAFFAAHCPAWRVQEAGSGAEALALASTDPPDFVTMDINMPGINGFEAAEQLTAAHPHVSMVMLTANIQESSRRQANAQRIRFVAKPATETSLQQALAFLLTPP